MSSVDTCINKINNNTNYNDLQQQITTKGPYLYTFNTINNRSDKLYPDNPTIKFQKNGYLDNNYNNLVDKHSLLLNLDNKWLEVQFTPGEFVINFGEMLQMWSNNKVKATQHRVRGNENERISIPLFYNPSFYTNIAPQNSGDKITAGDYLTKRYNETYIHLKNKK